MESEIIPSNHDAVWSLTQRMLTAARSGDWNGLIVLERERSEIVGRAAENSRKNFRVLVNAGPVEMIQKVLACDQEIAVLTERRLVDLRSRLESLKTEKKLLDTYNSRT